LFNVNYNADYGNMKTEGELGFKKPKQGEDGGIKKPCGPVQSERKIKRKKGRWNGQSEERKTENWAISIRNKKHTLSCKREGQKGGKNENNRKGGDYLQYK